MQASQLIAMPLTERLHAMEVLWGTLTQGDQAQAPAPDWHKKTVLARVKALRAGEASFSLDQVKVNIQKRIRHATANAA